MKVLHLSGSKHHWSGNEQQLADLMRNLETIGVESAVFCYENSAIEHYVQEHQILYFSQRRRSIYSPKLAYQLKKVIKEHDFDVIHVHTSNFLTLFMVSDLLYCLHIPTVFSRKGLRERSGRLSQLKYNYKGINRIICVSQAVCTNFKTLLKPQNHSKTIVIYDGISVDDVPTPDPILDIREKYSIPEEQHLIGNIANHVEAKDLPTMVKTVDYLVNKLGRKDIHLLQIGEKTEITEHLEHLIKTYDVSRFITFMGKVEHAKMFMPQFDLFLMTSQSEGLPLTIYEAFLNKVPVVSTNAGGIPEAMTRGENGYITEIGNYKQLAEDIVFVLDNKEKQESIVRNAYSLLMNRFTALQCAKQTKELYESIL